LQCVAVRCSMLQCIAVSVFDSGMDAHSVRKLQCVAGSVFEILKMAWTRTYNT